MDAINVLRKEELRLTIGVRVISGMTIEPGSGAYQAFGVLDAVFAKVQPRADIVLDLPSRRNKLTRYSLDFCQCKCWFLWSA